VVNALYPPYEESGARATAAHRLWRDRRAVNDGELQRIRSVWDGPILELPLLAIPPGPELVRALAGYLGTWMGDGVR
jgi:hypothetical protein